MLLYKVAQRTTQTRSFKLMHQVSNLEGAYVEPKDSSLRRSERACHKIPSPGVRSGRMLMAKMPSSRLPEGHNQQQSTQQHKVTHVRLRLA